MQPRRAAPCKSDVAIIGRPARNGTLLRPAPPRLHDKDDRPNSAGSQFYICLAPAPFLDNQYTVFGQVVSGMEVVDKIQRGDKMKSVAIQR